MKDGSLVYIMGSIFFRICLFFLGGGRKCATFDLLMDEYAEF